MICYRKQKLKFESEWFLSFTQRSWLGHYVSPNSIDVIVINEVLFLILVLYVFACNKVIMCITQSFVTIRAFYHLYFVFYVWKNKIGFLKFLL